MNRLSSAAKGLDGLTAALELVLQALSTPATPAELDEIRRLLDERNGGTT